ncbi:MAG: CAP domain-containing protein [Aquihabitans sp.]
MDVSTEKSVVGTKVLRRSAMVAVAAVMALVLSACLNGDQSAALKALNADRTANGVPTLVTNQQAQAKAQAWANKLAKENNLYHSTLSSGISSCWTSLGENVAYGGSIQAVQNQFMTSSRHKANAISRTWNGVGIGVAKNGNRVFVVQVFIKSC